MRHRPHAALALALTCCVAACSEEALPVVADEPFVAQPGACTASSDPSVIEPCSTGSGLFGEWFLDDARLPAYRYRFDAQADERAAYATSEGLDRRDHWFAFGNSRINALAFNDGHVEVVDQDRGVTHWNALSPAAGNYGGGFGWLDDGEVTWCTGWNWRPQPSRTRREFGVGGALYELEHRGVRSTRRLFAPPGDAAALISEVTLTNTSRRARTAWHYEYWDVARRNIAINWLVSGDLSPGIPAQARAERDALNGGFREEVSWDPERRALLLRRTPVSSLARPDAATADPVDFYPADPFLAVLEGDVDAVFTDQADFFGDGGPGAPAAVVARREAPPTAGAQGRATPGSGQRRAFIVRTRVELAPGESRRLRFVLGTVPHGQALALEETWRTVTLADAQGALSPHLLRFTTPAAPHLHRELAWHSAQLEASVGRREFQGQHVVPQGSAYLYLHGADGAARDLGLFTLPLVYTHPALAREELTFFMQVHRGADQQFSYAFQGHGMLDDALGIHRAPSDLDLFFLLGLTEYVFATGDESLLDAEVPYSPRDSVPGATGWHHARAAVRHLLDVVGTGPHGLIRVGTGDWSDGIVASSPVDRALAVRDGESVPNSQMALYVLPRAAALVESRDPALAAELRARLHALRAAVAATWTGQHFGRAYFGDGTLYRRDTPDLEAQVWPLIAGEGLPTPADEATLVQTVSSRLSSPLGATLTPGGEVWPAISFLWTWGLARSGRAPEAWSHLAANTLHAHAIAFPDVWYGVWSAPDGLSSTTGLAWSSPATPMRDFPVQNNNAHALPLFAAIKAAGVEATPAGLRIAPVQGTPAFSFTSSLLDVSWDGARLHGTWRLPPGASTTRTLEVALPAPITHIDGAAVTPRTSLTAHPDSSGRTPFDVSTR